MHTLAAAPSRNGNSPHAIMNAFRPSPPRPRLPPRADVVDGVHGSALVSYSAGISACEKGEQWQRALALLGEMWESNMVPDEIIYNAGISACEKG